ncbi:MAG: ribosome biogenesis GTPase Der [Candidatus Saccharibacteria bacterium]|nr:ribosome biogenesis GTPase Der [Candidatus Saccharibacteria bacterium]
MSKSLPIVAIVGRANVGKSSLFNAVLRRREAIVAREAGTTRDSIFAIAQHHDRQFWLVDTAGVKTPEDDFEFTIQEQITQAADSADVIWVVIEADTKITEEDRRLAKLALKSKKPVFLVANKADKAKKATENDYKKLGIKDIVLTSTTQNGGINRLLDEVIEVIPKRQKRSEDTRINLALLGRPNVGKSKLFNAMAKKQQAVVSERAGTTRDVNRIDVRYEGREMHLMDTAGIRKSGKIGKGIEHFSVIRSLAAIEQADICLLLIDVNELGVSLDQKIAGMIKEANKGLVLVVSKWDPEGRSRTSDEASAADLFNQARRHIMHTFDFVPWAPLIFTSAVDGQNVTKLFELALEIYGRRQTQIKTAKLNKWLKKTTDSHPPAGLKNKKPKLHYIMQESDNPTNFKVFGSDTKFLHWSYKRHMERSFRETFGFEGTAIRFWFFDRRDPKRSERNKVQETDSSQN